MMAMMEMAIVMMTIIVMIMVMMAAMIMITRSCKDDSSDGASGDHKLNTK